MEMVILCASYLVGNHADMYDFLDPRDIYASGVEKQSKKDAKGNRRTEMESPHRDPRQIGDNDGSQIIVSAIPPAVPRSDVF
jgi:hypothetical protein